MQESQTEEEEKRKQQRMKVMTDMTNKIKSKDGMGANSSWWVSEWLAADCQKCGSTQIERTPCSNGTSGCMKRRGKMSGNWLHV